MSLNKKKPTNLEDAVKNLRSALDEWSDLPTEEILTMKDKPKIKRDLEDLFNRLEKQILDLSQSVDK